MIFERLILNKAIGFLVCFFAGSVVALSAQSESDFDYIQNADGKITITKYLGMGIKDVVIPSHIQGD
jgi:hypothetical protein